MRTRRSVPATVSPTARRSPAGRDVRAVTPRRARMTHPVVGFDPFSADFFDDPYDTYRALRDRAPVYHDTRYGFWALSRFDDVLTAHRDWQTFSSAHGVTLHDLRNPDFRAVGTIIYLDPPEHERLRNLVSKAFTPRAIAALEPTVRTIVGETLDRVAGRGAFDGSPTSRPRFRSR